MKFNNETIRTAVKEWLDDPKKAEEKYGHISDWDVSNVTNMKSLFMEAKDFNEDIGKWNVSNVTDMSCLFLGAESFNQDIGNWDVSNVTVMFRLFAWAKSFNQDIGKWDVSNVTDMEGMFNWAVSFNKDIGKWDVSKVTYLTQIFFGAKTFNQNIGHWNLVNCEITATMFKQAEAFNQDIGNWNVSNVHNMGEMFEGAKSFNQDIGNWNVSNVHNMGEMFCNATSFNKDISNWDVSNVADMSSIFENAVMFNQDISNWKINNFCKRHGKKHMFKNAYSYKKQKVPVKHENKTIKFRNELKKYSKNGIIEIKLSKNSVREEFIYEGEWKNKKFKMKIILFLKNADYNYNGTVEDLIKEIGNKNITELNEKNLSIEFIGDGGGDFQIDKIIWEEKLSKEEKKNFNQRDILKKWLVEGMQSIEDKMVFEKGCIEEIKVTIGNKIIKLLK